MSQIYTQEDVDRWIEENGEDDAYALLNEMLPKHRAKLNQLDSRIRKVLKEIREVFPDAQYYTGSGGFNLLLGDSHGGGRSNCAPRQERMAWGGLASIGDGDW